MTSNNNPNNIEEISGEIDADNSVSIDDFIKQLEEKEKDLDISSEMVIEVEDSEIDETHISDIPNSFIDDKHTSLPPDLSAYETVSPINSEPNNAEISKLENKIAELENKISRMEAERSEYLENSVRRQKDFENYKNRTERERENTFNKQLGNLATRMLPVLDNFNRALDVAAEIEGEKLKDVQQFFDGIILVNQQLNEVLMEMGVNPIKAVNEIFDPNFHEAVATEETEKFPSHTIIEEILRGYRIGNRVIRPAMVKVATSPSTQIKSTQNTFTENSSNED